MIYVVATLRIKPGTQGAVREAAMPCVIATRREDGCVSYELAASMDDPDTLFFVECWRDRAALDAHFGMPHFQAWRAAGAPHILERKVEIIEPAKVETL